jgi:hypothetical protein
MSVENRIHVEETESPLPRGVGDTGSDGSWREGDNMTRTWKCVRLASLLLVSVFALVAHADSVSMQLTGVGNGTVMGGVYVNPYNATVNGTPTIVICDDFAADSYLGETWTANVSTFSDLSKTKWGTSAALQYNEAAWLTIQLLQLSPADTATQSAISFAIWELFTPTASLSLNPTQQAATQVWLDAVAKASQSFSAGQFSDFVVYTPDASKPIMVGGTVISPTNPPQEFLARIRVAEPSALGLLLFNLTAVVGAAFLMRRRVISHVE